MIFPTHRSFPWFEDKIRQLGQLPSVIDLGTSQRFAKEISFLRDAFDENSYKAMGYHPEDFGPDTCDYDGDLLALPFEDESWDGAVCLQVVEHVLDPFKAIAEVHRVLKPGGLFLFSVPFLVSYHGHPRPAGTPFDPSHLGFPDFWRFTHEGLEVLLQHFAEVEIYPADGPIEVRLHFLRFDRFRWYRARGLQNLIKKFDKPGLGRATTRHFCFARKAGPAS